MWKLLVLFSISVIGCVSETGVEPGLQGAAGGPSVDVGLVSEALIPGTYTFKNSNSGSNMGPSTAVNVLRGILMGQDPRASSNSWSCVFQTGGIVAQCTSVWNGLNQKATLSTADCVTQPPQTGYTFIKKCPFKFIAYPTPPVGQPAPAPVLMGNITWFQPTGRFWTVQGEVTNFVPGQTFQVFSTTGTEAGWNERVQSK